MALMCIKMFRQTYSLQQYLGDLIIIKLTIGCLIRMFTNGFINCMQLYLKFVNIFNMCSFLYVLSSFPAMF